MTRCRWTRVKSTPVAGSVHNVYVTPDGKFAVSGSVRRRDDQHRGHHDRHDGAHDQDERGHQADDVRHATLDGSTKNIYVQLSNYHGFAVVDFASGHRDEAPRASSRFLTSTPHTDGLQGAPAHGLGVTPDGKPAVVHEQAVQPRVRVFAARSEADRQAFWLASIPEWITFTPDGRFMYIGAAGDNTTVAVDVKAMKVVATIPVGQVPKRIATAVLQH